jgi:hypothetical protein
LGADAAAGFGAGLDAASPRINCASLATSPAK